MKLKEWAEKQGVAYLTAYRWFKDGKLPAKAYQTESGTIIVQDDAENLENNMATSNQQNNDIMSLFLKKTVEFSKNNASVEDFAAFVLSNFSLQLNTKSDTPKYSKNKPKPEDVKKHFDQFLKPKGEKPKPYMFVTEPEKLDELVAQSDSLINRSESDNVNGISGSLELNSLISQTPMIQDLVKDLSAALSSNSTLSDISSSVKTYDNLVATEGVVVRNVELTPQSINYTSSTSSTFGLPNTFMNINSINTSEVPASSYMMATSNFQPTTKEIEKAHQVLDEAASQIRAIKSRRGRKPSKKTGKTK